MSCHYVNRLVSQRGIDDVFGLYQHESLADLDRDLIPPDLPARHHLYDTFELIVQRGPPGPFRAEAPARPLERLFEARGVDRFQ